MSNKPTITRFAAGLYHFTGWIAGCLVQYSILNTEAGWVLTKTYGQGNEFRTSYPTKRAAINALTSA